MLDVFPELDRTCITHSWSGLVGYTFDHVPHLGEHDGLHYAMGYCGSGISLASYFGMRNSSLTPWNRRRVIPIGSYMIATERLDPALVSKLCPKSRVMSDTRKLVFYFRICPEKRRILFGGRVALNETNPDISAPRLHAAMCKIFPELYRTRIRK